MAMPDYQTLMLPVLKLSAEGIIPASNAVERLADEFELTEEERSEPMPSGKGNQTLFNNRVHWAITYLAHARVIERPKRAHFSITERGRELLSRELPEITKDLLLEYPEFEEWIKRGREGRPRPRAPEPRTTTPAPISETPLERVENDLQELAASLLDDLLDRILGSSPAFFESLIVDLLVAMGYGGTRASVAKAIGKSGDEGIDGIINQDPLGLDVVYIQAKRYQPDNTIGRSVVQAFAGSLEGVGAMKGILVTTSSFSRKAIEYAERVMKRIILIDGDQLTRLLVEYGVGVRTSSVYEVKRIDEDYFET